MSIFDWLVIASLLVSFFVLISQLGVLHKLKSADEVLKLLVAKAMLDAEISRRKDIEEKVKSPYSKGSNSEH